MNDGSCVAVSSVLLDSSPKNVSRCVSPGRILHGSKQALTGPHFLTQWAHQRKVFGKPLISQPVIRSASLFKCFYRLSQFTDGACCFLGKSLPKCLQNVKPPSHG